MTTADKVVVELGAASDEYNRKLAEASGNFDKFTNNVAEKSAGAVKLTSAQLQNVTYQINDLAQVLATGQSPFRAIIQQGSQIIQVFNPGTGVGGALKQVGASLVQFLTNPLTLATIGFAVATQAAYALFDAVIAGGRSAETVLKDNKDYVDRIRDAYGLAKNAAHDFHEEQSRQKDVSEGLDRTKESADKLAAQLNYLYGTLQAILTDPGAENDFGSVILGRLKELQDQIKAGTADTKAWTDEFYKIANDPATDAGLRDLMKQLADMTDQAAKLQVSLKGVSDVLNDIRYQGYTSRTDEAGALTQYNNRAKDDLAAQRRRQDAALLAARARTPQEKAEAARQGVLAQPVDPNESPDVRALKAQNAAELALAQSERTLTDAQAARKRSYDDALDQERLEIELLGKTAGQQAALRYEFELTQSLREQSARTGIPIDQQELALIHQKAEAYGSLVDELEHMQDAQDAQQFFAQSLYDSARGAKSLADAVSNLASKLAEAVAQATLLGTGPLAGIFGTKSSGASGGLIGQLIGGLFGGGGGGVSFPTASSFRASGGPVDAGKSYIVGERGIERFVPSVPGRIEPNSRLSGGGATNIFAPVVHAPGATAEAVESIRGELRSLYANFNKMTIKSVKAARMSKEL